MLGSWRLWLRHPPRHRDEQEWRSQHTELLAGALTRLMAAAHRLFGYDVRFVGTEPRPRPDRPLLVLARHAGPGDSFTLVHLLATRFGRNPRVILKQALQWDPGLDVVLTRLRCHFLPSRSGAGEDRSAAVAQLEQGTGPGRRSAPLSRRWQLDAETASPLGRAAAEGRPSKGGRPSSRSNQRAPAAAGRHRRGPVRTGRHRRRRPGARGLDTLVNPRQMWRALPLHERPMRIRAWLHQADTVPRDETGIRSWLDEQWGVIDQWVDTEQRHD